MNILTETVTVPSDLVTEVLVANSKSCLFTTCVDRENFDNFMEDFMDLYDSMPAILAIQIGRTAIAMVISDPTDSDIETIYEFLYSRKINVIKWEDDNDR